jgi:hypothetical protein
VALRTASVARVNIGQLLEALAALGDWVEQQPLPDEEQPAPGVAWGWGQVGQTTPAPGGAARSS